MTRAHHLPLLLLLAVGADAALMFMTVVRDMALWSPTLAMTAVSICACRSQCIALNCTAAAYDKNETVCNMTQNPSLGDIIVQQQADVILLLTFEFPQQTSSSTNTVENSPCPPTTWDGVVFLTSKETGGGVDDLKNKCANEKGEPFIIKTQEQKTAALDAMKDAGVTDAWLTVTKGALQGAGSMVWPDGSAVMGCAFTRDDIIITPFQTLGKLTSKGTITDKSLFGRYRVLCVETQ